MASNVSWDVAVHEHPVWRERANFIIAVTIERGRWEQLWARQVGEHRFEICCIPFFAYNLALGDEVETAPENGRQYMVQRVAKPSGHYTFRGWFDASSELTARENVVVEAEQLGCAHERWASRLVAFDAGDPTTAQRLADYLQEQEDQGVLIYETGLEHDRPTSSPPSPV